MNEDNHIIIVGTSQLTQDKKTNTPLDPLSLIIETSKKAIKDTNANSSKLVTAIDSVYMTNIRSWSYEDAPGELSQALGINPKKKIYLPDGGNTPQMLVNRASKALFTGNANAILIAGGETFYTAYKSIKIKHWPPSKPPKYMEGDLWDGINEFENSYGIKNPPLAYALFETALRYKMGKSIDEHNLSMGKLFEKFSYIASQNPISWIKESYTADEIAKPTVFNRIINHPYTKRMCANMFVDQSAVVIIMTVRTARKLDINKSQWVYVMGGSDFQNIYEITRRPALHDSPAAREGSKSALKQAGLDIKDINVFDIYSCFPSIVQIICNEIGISTHDHRDLTLTGGLPFFGGPWSNYSMHAIVSAVQAIRKNPTQKIMVIANGGYNNKQSFGIYGKSPPKIPWDEINDDDAQDLIFSQSLEPPLMEAKGTLIIEGYTLVYNRKGEPYRGIVIGKLENGRRTLAQINSKTPILQKLSEEELVGKVFPVSYDKSSKKNLIQIK